MAELEGKPVTIANRLGSAPPAAILTPTTGRRATVSAVWYSFNLNKSDQLVHATQYFIISDLQRSKLNNPEGMLHATYLCKNRLVQLYH